MPAIAETIAGFDFAPTIGVFVARGTPLAVIERFSIEMTNVARLPELIQSLSKAGVVAVGAGSLEFEPVIQSEIERMAKAVAAAGLKPE